MDKSQIDQLFCLHDTKHYWFYFFKEYLELISYSGIMETPPCEQGKQHMSKRGGPSAVWGDGE